MEFKQATVSGLSQQLVKQYHRFFELTPEATAFVEQPQMQPAQIQLFMTQAFERHYHVAVQFNVNDHLEQMTGRLVKQLSANKYLLKESRSNLYKIVLCNQIRYIQKKS
ncbi:hypothetical protein BCY75_08975 [Latilactobacillus curvatus]|uniref:hypothetical protein n=1 Tax=Latilactobacillus curvatus TaxID=28038 RepID=UPI000814C258|nr:hypothetical protein [Latilactobacillus curvatus]ANY14114.1 hypothetical protein BCY75_08975 [Latilactobacillus curvatus]